MSNIRRAVAVGATSALIVAGLAAITWRATSPGQTDPSGDPTGTPTPTASATSTATDSTDSTDTPARARPSFIDEGLLQRCLVRAASEAPPLPTDESSDLVDATTDQVAALRGLPATEEIDATVLTSEELAERVAEEVDAELDDAELDAQAALLVALGVIEPGTDLRALYVELQEGQVAGFYDPDTGELVIRSDSADPSPSDRVALAHEIQHALADQRFELDLDELPGGSDADIARLAVIEGDATLTMTVWATRALSVIEQLRLSLDPAALAAEEGLDAVPYAIVGSLLFPYEAGVNLACDAYLEGGWSAVDALYADPPETTAQVLDPARRRADERAVEVALPPAPGPEFTLVDDDTFGQLDLQLIFAAPGDDPARALDDPAGAAGAWRGGRVGVWDGPAQSVVDLVLAGDADGQLCADVTRWLLAAFPGIDLDPATVEDGVDVTATTPDPRTLRCEGDRVSLRTTLQANPR